MSPRVLLDVDGVLCAFLPGVLKLVHEHTGRYHTAEDVKRFDFANELGLDSVTATAVKSSISRRPNWWRSLEPYPGAREGLDALRKVADVWIVTSPWWSCKTWLGERYEWLDKHMGVPASRIVMTGAKHLVAGDFLVDDKTSTLREWAPEHPMGTPIQWVTPHNRLDGWTGVATCDWGELVAAVTRGPTVDAGLRKPVANMPCAHLYCDTTGRCFDCGFNVSPTADSPAPPAVAASVGPAGGEAGDLFPTLVITDEDALGCCPRFTWGDGTHDLVCEHAHAPAITRTPAVEVGEEE